MQPNLPPELNNFSRGKIGSKLLSGDWLSKYREQIATYTCVNEGGSPTGNPAICPSGATPDEEKRQLRNSIVDAIIAKIDIEYYRYSSGLQIGNGYIGLAGDLATLGMNSAGAIVGDAELKSILAAASAGVTGTTASIDKRLFLDQSRQAVVATMDGSRAKQRALITSNEKNGVAAYTIEQALSDLQSYYVSGTITSAFLSIQTTAGKAKDKGDQDTVGATADKGQSLTPVKQ